jgi:predicted AAA+ superfamily ATPase
MYIERAILKSFKTKLKPNKVLILLGARRVGKTALIDEFLKTEDEKSYLKLHGEDISHVNILQERTIANYNRLLNNKSLLIIDEAQSIPEIGLILKLIVDNIPNIKIIATGSSMFDLGIKLGEPLVGRKNTLYLFPLAQMEFSQYENFIETKTKLEERLIFGSYPELEEYTDWKEKENYLKELINSYLLKDILAFEGIRNANKIIDLLKLIAFQIGKEISVQELGQKLSISKNTVESYLDLLTKVFILIKVKGYSKNLRKEITKMNRWYFADNGIRNAIIANFNRIDARVDIGDLWENYFITERIKYHQYNNKNMNYYFWRTYDQQEIDWIEEDALSLDAFELKWNSKRKTKIPKAWETAYPNATFQVVNQDNYLGFIV